MNLINRFIITSFSPESYFFHLIYLYTQWAIVIFLLSHKLHFERRINLGLKLLLQKLSHVIINNPHTLLVLKCYMPGIAAVVALFMFSILLFWMDVSFLATELNALKASNSNFNESDKSSSDFSFSVRSPVVM